MRNLILLCALLSFGNSFFSQVLEPFNFTGSLNANGWTTHSGTAGQFQALSTISDCQNSLYLQGMELSTGNRITFTAGNTEDVNKAITGITGIGYYSFLLKVTNTTGLSASGDYFTGFGGTAGASVTIFAPRVFVKAGVTTNTFTLGILNTTGGTPAPTPTYSAEYPVGTTVLVVVKLDATTSPIQASLFVNPTAGASEPAATVTSSAGTNTFANFASIFLRQAGSSTSGTGNLQIDEIRVGSTWEFVTPACQQILSWYPDTDGDGFGALSPVLQSCCQPTGYVSDNTDCDDANASINPNTIWYADIDGDGFGDAGSTSTGCALPLGYVLNSTDCNDGNPSINALVTYYQDLDQDGYGNPSVSVSNCGQPAGYVSNNTDCNDNSSSENPGVTEIADNIDNDCDGLTDEGFSPLTWFLDSDQDGFGGPTSVQSVTSPGPNYTLTGGDCDDQLIAVYPGATEICDGIDNNCDGQFDNGLTFTLYYADNDGDTYGDPNDSTLACSQPSGYVTNNTDCDDANASLNPGATDIPENGIDEDCSGQDAPLIPINLGMYQFTGTVDCATQDNAVTSQPSGATFSLFSGVGTNCSAAGGVFNRSGWNTLTTVDLTEYNEFSLTAEDCKKLNLDRVAFKFRPSGSAGSPIWHLRSSVDNFAADLDFGTGANVNSAYIFDTVYLSNHTNLDQVTFRFYLTEILGTTTTWRMDDVSLFGTILSVVPQTYYADVDGDGFGDPLNDTLTCTQLTGFILDNTDCNDQSAAINPTTVWYSDVDNDQIGDSTISFTGCTPPTGYVLAAGDCDNSNPQISGPVTYYVDNDGDTFGDDATAQSLCQNPGIGYVSIGGDCNDANDQIYPGATEICDSEDNDCDGSTDEGLNFVTYYTDADNDGFGTGNTGVSLCEVPGPGFSTNNEDCDDTDGQINPNSTDILDNGIDENCDGVDGILGVNDILSFSSTIYPNPTSGNSYVIFSTKQKGELCLRDLNGKIVFNNSFDQKEVEIMSSGLTPGTYILELNINGRKLFSKLMKL